MKLLSGKTALITGASRGIGRAIAETFAAHGASIAFTATHQSNDSESLLSYLQAQGVQALFFAADAADPERAAAVAKGVEEAFGRTDILVNNAGITRDQLLFRLSPEDWNSVIATDLGSVYNYCRAFAPMMARARRGSIINISSIVALNGNAGQCNYAAAKAGIIGFTRSAAKELGGRNIRCNALAPGFIDTDMTARLSAQAREGWIADIPMRRPGTTEEVAHAALFLASDLSAYISGQTLCCDGGLSL